MVAVAARSHGTGGDVGAKTILLVEDERELARAMARELEAEGYAVRHAASGEEALALCAASRPALIILDWMLPGLSGLEVLRQLRAGAGGEAAALPVLMVTARGSEMDRVVGLEVGADDYMAKPFSMRELIARVHSLLRRVEALERIMAADRAPAPEVLTWGGLVVDPQAYTATCDGTPLELTRTELELLALLMRHPGRVFSRAYLLDAIWGEHYVAGDRSVDNAILRLRRKLGALGEAVETVWGVGYRMVGR